LTARSPHLLTVDPHRGEKYNTEGNYHGLKTTARVEVCHLTNETT